MLVGLTVGAAACTNENLVAKDDAGAGATGGLFAAGGTSSGGGPLGGSTAAGAGGIAKTGGSSSGGSRPTGGTAGGGSDKVTLTASYDTKLRGTWHNGLGESIFLYGCGTWDAWRLENSAWVNHGIGFACSVEGVEIEVPAGGSFVDSYGGPIGTVPIEGGTYQLRGTYGVGCTPQMYRSQAGCSAINEVVSNQIVVPETGGTGGAGGGGSGTPCATVQLDQPRLGAYLFNGQIYFDV